jgi:exosortase A-associated hydrolase 2
MMERSLYINSGNKHIFSVIHTPDNKTNKKGIIFIHPYAEEKQRVDRIFVNCARQLCSNGYFVMRFDFFGCGDSEGNFEELSYESQISDLRIVKNFFVGATGVENIFLFGVRLGANIAVQYAEIDNTISNIFLWSPIINGADYAETLLRNKIFSSLMDKHNKITKEQIMTDLSVNGRVDIDGFYLTKSYYDFLKDLNGFTKNSTLNFDAFIGITKEEGKFIEKYSIFTKIFKANGRKCILVPTDDKMYWLQRSQYELYFPNDLIKKTIDWMIRLLRNQI